MFPDGSERGYGVAEYGKWARTDPRRQNKPLIQRSSADSVKVSVSGLELTATAMAAGMAVVKGFCGEIKRKIVL